MDRTKLTNLAATLAADLEVNGHDVTTADILDSLASTSMTLVEDADGTATEGVPPGAGPR